LVLLIDNYDSFTYNLLDYLHQLNVNCKVVRNDISLEDLTPNTFQGVVISPGPERPDNAGNLLPILSHYSSLLPILGICLGHQAIGLKFGAKLVKAKYPMHGKISRIKCTDSAIFKDLPKQLNVVRYHSLILRSLPHCLQVIAQTESNEIMAIRHRSLEIHGLQFHPEAYLTEGGFQMIRNWVGFYNIAN
jgi:anthranilate synthase/aminodeoxychorismate synthase-like glutamine amidotransferase